MWEKEVNIPSSYTFIMRSHKGFEWHYRRSKVQTPLIQLENEQEMFHTETLKSADSQEL